MVIDIKLPNKIQLLGGASQLGKWVITILYRSYTWDISNYIGVIDQLLNGMHIQVVSSSDLLLHI